MRIVDALEGIAESRFGASIQINKELIFSNKDEVVPKVKEELIWGILSKVMHTEKLDLEQRESIHPHNIEYTAEVYILTREEMERLIINVEINTRREVVSALSRLWTGPPIMHTDTY